MQSNVTGQHALSNSTSLQQNQLPRDESQHAAGEAMDCDGDQAPPAAETTTSQPCPARTARRRLPNLPAGFTEDVASIGPLVLPDEGAGSLSRPKDPDPVPVVFHGTKVMPQDHLYALPGGEKPHRVNKTLTVAEHLVAADYSDRNGYTTAHGKRDMQALLRDAHNRKLVSIRLLFALALGYEKQIAALKSDGAQSSSPPGATPDSSPGATPDSSAPNSTDHARSRRQPSQKRPKSASDAAKRPRSAPTLPPGISKRGRKAKPDSTPESADRRRSQRARKRLFGWVGMMLAFLGGSKAELTSFVVSMIKAALVPTGIVRRYVFLTSDVIARLLDDDRVAKVIYREVDKRRRPPISRFVLAAVKGCSTTSMDALRFACSWMPGHSTLSKAKQAFEKTLEQRWCPSGPVPSRGTTLSPEEQQREATSEAESAPDDEDEDEELEAEVDAAMHEPPAEPTPREVHEATAASFQQQALPLLAAQYPAHPPTKIFDQWGGGADADWPFRDEGWSANVLHIVAHRAGQLLAFQKALLTPKELFVDEQFTAPAGRRQGLASQLMLLACNVASAQRLVRLQVADDNEGAIDTYKAWGMEPWEPRKSGWFQKVEETTDDGYGFMEGSKAGVRTKVAAICKDKPLAADVEIFVMATFAIRGVELHHIGVLEPPEAAAAADVSAAAAAPEAPAQEPSAAAQAAEPQDPEGASPTCENAQVPRKPGLCEDGDDTLDAAASEDTANPKVAPSHGCKSLVDAITMMLVGTYAYRPGPLPHKSMGRTHAHMRRACIDEYMPAPDHLHVCCCVRTALCHMEIFLPHDFATSCHNGRTHRLGDADSWSHAVYPAFKPTADGARWQNAPKGRQSGTQFVLVLLATGMRNVQHLASLPSRMRIKVHSCVNAFMLRVWFGKDDAANVRSHPNLTHAHLMHTHVMLMLPGAFGHADASARRTCHGRGRKATGDRLRA